MDVASTRCTPQARNRYFGEIDKQCQQLAKRARQEAIRVVIEDRIKGKSEPRRPGQIADNGGLKGFGSGFIITSDGYLLTNDHVVKDSNRVMIKTETGVMPARIVMSDPDNDIALLKMDGDFSTAPFASEHTAKLGQTVFTVGFPMPEIQGFSPKVTKGVISSINGIQDDPDMYQIDAAIQPGNSGGPLADDRGRVVGIVVARLNDAVLAENTGVGAQHVNFAIKNIVIREHLEKRPDVMAETFAMESPVASTFEEAVEKIRKATVLVMVY